MWRHVGPGSGGDCPARTFGKLFSSSNNEFLFYSCTLADIVEREWIDGDAQLIETIDVLTTEIFVV